MKNYEFKPVSICARQIDFALDGDTISGVEFHGGCSGNAKGIANLLEGTDVHEAIKRLENINCQNRGTSCPAQLAIALQQALEGTL
jgi:uncharacterized protein (TIGR03905 family)